MREAEPGALYLRTLPGKAEPYRKGSAEGVSNLSFFYLLCLEYLPDYSFISFSTGNSMFVIRLYITALTLLFFAAAMMNGISVLEAIVVSCPLIYMILDMREELGELKLLEGRVSLLSR